MLTSLVVVVGLLAVVSLVLLVRQRHVTTRLRGRLDTARRAVEQRDLELQHLATVRLPALVESVGGKQVEVPPPLYEDLTNSHFGTLLNRLLEMAARYESGAVRLADEQARSAMVATARTVQGLAAKQQAAISAMQHRHDDPRVLEDLLNIDHANSQLSRRAQTLGVMGGSWPGTQRSAASDIVDVVRGAMSRIRDYQRVEISSRADAQVLGSYVEPIVLAVAELLDNAASFSAAGTVVRADVQQASNGISIVIDDAGIGMTADEIARVTSLLNRGASVEIHELGDPARIGLPVCGALANRYGFKVSVDASSPYGGVRAVVFIPRAMLVSHTARTAGPNGHRSLLSSRPAPTRADATGRDEDSGERTENGLPKRRRREPPVAAPVADPVAASGDHSHSIDRSVQARASNFAGWQQAAANRSPAIPGDHERTLES